MARIQISFCRAAAGRGGPANLLAIREIHCWSRNPAPAFHLGFEGILS